MRPIRNVSVKRRVMAIFAALALPAVLVLGIYTATAMGELRTKLARAGESSLSLFAASLQTQMNAAETYMVDMALHSEDLRRLGSETSRTQAYLDGYEVSRGFSAVVSANEALAGLMLYSVPNDLYMAQYGTVAGGGPEQKTRAKQEIQAEVTELVGAGPLDTEHWFAREMGGRTYWMRVVRYRSVYLASVIDLGLLLDRAATQYDFDGQLILQDEAGAPLLNDAASIEPGQLQWKPEGYGTLEHEGQPYLCVTASAGQLHFLYLMPFQGAQGAMRPLELVLAACTVLVLVAIPVMWAYLRRTVFRPLDSLVDTMEQIGQGELTARPSTMYKNKEFKQVNDTFNNMIGQITALKIDSYERQLAAERSEMAALKMQIRPHFVLNCLKNVYALAETGRTGEIQSLILLLSRHLRYVLAYREDTVPLEREVELCQNYIELSGVGQERPAACSVELDGRLEELPVPPVSLLTLVENSVKHGAREGSILKILITARRLEMEEGALANITVSDNGPGFTPRQLEELNRALPREENGRHVGLANTLRRFQLLYGDDLAVAFANGREGGAKIELFLPLQAITKGDEEDETADRG